MERAKYQVAGLRGSHRHRDGFRITKLTDQDHVRIFAHGCADAFGEARDVCAELTLNYLAVLAAVNELNRIFEADDVQPPAVVQVVDHRCQGGGLAGPRGAGDEDHSLVVIA